MARPARPPSSQQQLTYDFAGPLRPLLDLRRAAPSRIAAPPVRLLVLLLPEGVVRPLPLLVRAPTPLPKLVALADPPRLGRHAVRGHIH